MKKIGFIDYYLNEWHADNYPIWIKEASGGEFQVKYCWGEIDSPLPGGISNEEWAKKNDIELCATLEEVVQKSDLLCVLAPDNPETHGRLTKVPLMSGKPTYVDKTFAEDKEAAIQILNIAEKYNTPCISTSALRYASEYGNIKKDKINGIVSTTGGVFEIYSIHLIEPIVSILGCDAKRVKSVGTKSLPCCIIEYSNGTRAVISMFNPGCPFQTIFNYSDGGFEIANIQSDFFHNFIVNMVEFFKSGDIIVPHIETIAVIAIREACIKAIRSPDKWIEITK